MLTIKNNNVLNDIKTYQDYNFHTIFCDPPYNLSTEWIIGKNGNPIVKNKSKDFMNKWDGLDETDLELFFKESYRVLKHGGYCIMFGLDRQLMPFNYYALKAGFEITQSLSWFFVQNFPKSADLSKNLDKRLGCERKIIGKGKSHISNKLTGEFLQERNYKSDYNLTSSSSDLAKQFDGYRYSKTPFKQSTETIMVFRKSSKISILDDIISKDSECSPSCINIDGGRILYTTENPPIPQLTQGKTVIDSDNGMYGRQSFNESKTKCTIGGDLSGRYPSTVFIDSNMSNIIDQQSGITKSGNSGHDGDMQKTYGDQGGCSRILHHCDYDNEEYDLLNFCSKVSQKERNAGLENFSEIEVEVGHNRFDKCSNCGGTILQNPDRPSACKCENPVRENNKMMKNNHPTVKPISLIQKITTLFLLPIEDQKLYIPFGGVFSEVIGASLAGFKNITTCELSKEYIKIGQARFEHLCKQTKKKIKRKDIFNF